MTIEDRIRTTLSEAVEGMEVPERFAISASDPNRGHKRRPLAAFGFGFAVVVLFGIAIWVLAPSGNQDVATPPTSGLLSGSQGPLEWRELDVFPSPSSPEVLVEGPAGWLLMAPLNDRTNSWAEALVLQSDDGVEWTELATSGFPNVVTIRGIVGAEDQYVAYGLFGGPGYTVTTVARPSNFPEPALWTSYDGMVWDLIPLPLPAQSEQISDNVSYLIEDVAIADDVTVVVGVEFDENKPEGAADAGSFAVPTRQIMWASSGGDWTIVSDARLAEAYAAAAGPAGIIAATLAADGGVDVWVTSDGRTWDPIGSIATEGRVSRLDGSKAGFLARMNRPGLWFSADGATWVQFEEAISPEAAYLGPHGFVVVDTAGNISWSLDLAAWHGAEISSALHHGLIDAAVTPYAVILIDSGPGGSTVLIGTVPN